MKTMKKSFEEGAQSVAGDVSNPVSKEFVEVGISNSTSTSKWGPDAANERIATGLKLRVFHETITEIRARISKAG